MLINDIASLWTLKYVHNVGLTNAFFGYLSVYNMFGTYPIKPKPTHVKRCI
jgi:hypothetical protein